jgi:type IV pilus assembly protein PilB
MECIKKPYGMILVTGPTGSGKTVTLYSALNILNEASINISTVEDPVEIQVPGINQVNMNPKTGLTFAAALRAFLRQDPDIVMVGEIRDLETAEIAVKAAQTGHLVLSTLHTNDAPQSLTRLANMGVPPFNIASSVLLILAQRLARRLCVHCRQIEEVPHEALLEEGFTEHEITEGFTIYGPVGCERCTDGYKGRVGIFQVIRVSEEMGRLIMEGGNAIQLADQAEKEGYADLRKAGLRKVKAGITSLQELNRVTKD